MPSSHSASSSKQSTATSKKTTLLFIHGFRGNGLGLKELTKKYFNSKKYDIHIPAIPPAGGNSLKEYSAISYARFVAKYIKKNQLEKPILIGHSMGSIIVAAVAERYPELIADKIIFLAPISKKTSIFFRLISPLSVLLPNRLVTYISTKYTFVSKDKALFSKALKTSYLCGSDYTKKTDVLKAARFSSTSSIDDFEFKKQALFLSGDHDRLMSHSKTDTVAAKFHAKNIYLPGCGHLLNYEKPKETADAIKKFLD